LNLVRFPPSEPRRPPVKRSRRSLPSPPTRSGMWIASLARCCAERALPAAVPDCWRRLFFRL
jgi:hypothetical protein